MKCPYCSFNNTKVVDSRDVEDITRRRRECLKCKKRFTTYERVEIDLIIIKKDEKREQFNRDKLKIGILKACEKRPVTNEQIDNIIKKIENNLRKLHKAEIESRIIGQEVMKSLKKLDNVAYIRFASVYKDFKDIDDFKQELRKIKG